jgi:catechol 2,3-dioxygenase-like lactoylglutathione lyase family enzyme
MFSHHRSTQSRLSSRAKRGICFFFIATALFLSVSAEAAPKRPRIIGIDQVQIAVTNVDAAIPFYRNVTPNDCIHGVNRAQMEAQKNGHHGYTFAGVCDFLPEITFFVDSCCQTLILSAIHEPVPTNLIEQVTFATDNVHELRRYLKANGFTPSKPRQPDTYLTITDPEGHLIGFVQRYPSRSSQEPNVPFPQLIHVGFVVHDRAAEDHFFKDILGFRLYWHGGMKDDQDNWVAMQVPDGTDWVEYMLGIPPDASHHTLGVMNHIAIGVSDVHATEQQLIKSGLKLTEAPKIGRDGKWQLNLYDPDDTRVEFMEFTPAEKPCCNPFTGPHPGPQK